VRRRRRSNHHHPNLPIKEKSKGGKKNKVHKKGKDLKKTKKKWKQRGKRGHGEAGFNWLVDPRYPFAPKNGKKGTVPEKKKKSVST